MKRWILLLVSLSLIFSLTACGGASGGGTTAPGTTAAPESTAPDVRYTDLVKDGASDYTLIYSATREGRSIGTLFRTKVKNLTGCDLNIQTDDKPAVAHEIRIGDVARDASPLAAGTYRLALEDGNLIIRGGDDAGLLAAIDLFFDMALQGSDLRLEENFACTSSVSRADEYLVAVISQAPTPRVAVFDLRTGSMRAGEEKWSWEWPTGQTGITDARLRTWNGRTVVAVCGMFYAHVIDYETKEVIWEHTGDDIFNAHSIELLPNGVIAIAGSTYNQLSFFDIRNQSEPVIVPFADAHGVVWDAPRGVVLAAGVDVIRAFEVSSGATTLTVSERTDLKATIPAKSAHDFYPVIGEEDMYWLSTSTALYRYNAATRKFTSYSASNGLTVNKVKSVGSFPDGTFVTVYPTAGNYDSWNSDTVNIYTPSRTLSYFAVNTVKSSADAFYKVRVWMNTYH